MNDREIKKKLRGAYAAPLSERSRGFIRQHTRRQITLGGLFRIAFESLGLSVPICLVLFLLGMALLITGTDTRQTLLVSSLCAASAAFVVLVSSKSQRHGMAELESSTRFSLPLLKVVRLAYSGFFSLLGLLLAAVLLCRAFRVQALYAVIHMGFPYLLTLWGDLVILRRWHRSENTYGCMAVALVSVLLSVLAEISRLWMVLPALIPFLALLVLLALTGREIIRYIQESEVPSWSLS